MGRSSRTRGFAATATTATTQGGSKGHGTQDGTCRQQGTGGHASSSHTGSACTGNSHARGACASSPCARSACTGCACTGRACTGCPSTSSGGRRCACRCFGCSARHGRSAGDGCRATHGIGGCGCFIAGGQPCGIVVIVLVVLIAPGNLGHASGSKLLAVGSLVARQRQHAVGMVRGRRRACLCGRSVRRHGLGHVGRLLGHRGGLSGKEVR